MISVTELFYAAELFPQGPVSWGEPIPEHNSGIYVIIEEPDRIVYIGRAKSIAKRMRQFYRHTYGDKSPHRGGQEILRLEKPKLVYWAPTVDFRMAESKMIAAFKTHYGGLPFGNKTGGDRLK